MSDCELKSCPFCGGYAYVDVLGESALEYRILCLNCGASSDRFLHEQDAVDAWNMRDE